MKILKTVKKITLRTKITKYQNTTHELLLTTRFSYNLSQVNQFIKSSLDAQPEINVLKQFHFIVYLLTQLSKSNFIILPTSE